MAGLRCGITRPMAKRGKTDNGDGGQRRRQQALHSDRNSSPQWPQTSNAEINDGPRQLPAQMANSSRGSRTVTAASAAAANEVADIVADALVAGVDAAAAATRGGCWSGCRHAPEAPPSAPRRTETRLARAPPPHCRIVLAYHAEMRSRPSSIAARPVRRDALRRTYCGSDEVARVCVCVRV